MKKRKDAWECMKKRKGAWGCMKKRKGAWGCMVVRDGAWDANGLKSNEESNERNMSATSNLNVYT